MKHEELVKILEDLKVDQIQQKEKAAKKFKEAIQKLEEK